MPGSGKIVERRKKKHGLAYHIISIFVFAIEAMLGINGAFLVDQSVSVVAHNMLAGTPFDLVAPMIALIISLALGLAFVAGGMWTFGGFMDNLDDARAYQEKYGTKGWPVFVMWCVFIGIIAIDFTTLLFRASFFAERGAVPLFAFFVLLIFMPPVLGPIMHVIENTPHDRRLAKARRYAEALDGDDIEQAIQEMDPDLRHRLLNGDETALPEHYQRIDAIRAENAAYEQRAIEERNRKQAEKNRPL